jgi:DNA-binding XRE family transcriptional regulator
MKYDLLHIQGKPYVLLPLHDYRELSGETIDDSLPNDVQNEIVATPDMTVRILRKYRGMTQRELAREAGISRPYLTEIETGRKQGSVKALKGISRALDVDMALLLRE